MGNARVIFSGGYPPPDLNFCLEDINPNENIASQPFPSWITFVHKDDIR